MSAHFLSFSPGTHGEAVGTRRKLYSAVPGRLFVVVRPYTAQAEGEINLYKGDRVKGETSGVLAFYHKHTAARATLNSTHVV